MNTPPTVEIRASWVRSRRVLDASDHVISTWFKLASFAASEDGTGPLLKGALDLPIETLQELVGIQPEHLIPTINAGLLRTDGEDLFVEGIGTQESWEKRKRLKEEKRIRNAEKRKRKRARKAAAALAESAVCR